MRHLALPALLLLAAPAAADCRGAELLPPGPLVPGERVEVRGEAFSRCADVRAGCRAPSTRPLDDVALVLEQGRRTVPLDRQDADAQGRVRFSARLPDDLAPGPAVLRASGAELTITVAPRR